MFITVLSRLQEVPGQFWASVSGYPGNKPIRVSIDYPGQGNFHQAVVVYKMINYIYTRDETPIPWVPPGPAEGLQARP